MALRITLGDLLNRCAGQFEERSFLTIAETGRSYAYGEFESLVNRLAHGLNDRFGDDLSYVAIFMENGVEYLAASYALKKIDAVEVSINHAMKGAPLARMIDQTKARALFTSGRHLEALDRIRKSIAHIRTLIMIDAEEEARRLFPQIEVIGFADILSDRTDHLTSPAKDTDTATILFTSGTTGVSKGCLLSHRYAVRTAENIIEPFRVTGEDCVYSPYPLSHIGPAYYDILPTMMTGGRVVLRQRFSASNFWPEVKRYGVTWFMMLGSVQQLLWANPPCPEEREHRVSRCWSTPAPVPKKDFDARFKVHLIPGGGYGSTDAGWVVAPQWDHPGGVILPHFEVAIHDEAGDPVPCGQPGQMVVRPLEPGVMSDGYFSMPDRTLASRKDLWFHTGDIARLDENDLFYFMHRMSERIRVKGEMVSAYEVEEGALAHPAVQDCAAIGIASEWGEEAIKLFVVKKPGFDLSADALKEHCATRMARFMVPEEIVFLDELPRTSTGKIEKGKLGSL
ncbi:MAG: AMP-binding protein [Ectothiorhodospiraceae bacterium AqS1]|nr:AMP-binding protein [Ectothiorhodospiraceae bacterium AqS1]